MFEYNMFKNYIIFITLQAEQVVPFNRYAPLHSQTPEISAEAV